MGYHGGMVSGSMLALSGSDGVASGSYGRFLDPLNDAVVHLCCYLKHLVKNAHLFTKRNRGGLDLKH